MLRFGQELYQTPKKHAPCQLVNNWKQSTPHTQKYPSEQNKQKDHKKKPQTTSILYLKSLSIWGYLRNLTVDPVYEIWITLEEKAILRGDEIKEMKLQISLISQSSHLS